MWICAFILSISDAGEVAKFAFLAFSSISKLLTFISFGIDLLKII